MSKREIEKRKWDLKKLAKEAELWYAKENVIHKENIKLLIIGITIIIVAIIIYLAFAFYLTHTV